MDTLSHGSMGSHLQPFTEIFSSQTSTFAAGDLAELAIQMQAKPDKPKDGADPEENLWVPAGYTYFAQFIDHDLTFDSTSSLNPADRPPQGSRIPSNLRTPRFDLDSLYGDGPDANPFMYEKDGASILTGNHDLLRSTNDRAIIGDKRNDENSIICQVHLGFIRYHNKVVADLMKEPPSQWNTPNNLFVSAQNEVRWTYQLLVVNDLLPRIVAEEVLADLQVKTPQERAGRYALYTKDKRQNLPREFVAAAYRYGHSGVRTGYRLNKLKSLPIFPGTGILSGTESLLGFDELPPSHFIDDWERFFPASEPGADIHMSDRVAATDKPDPAVRLQFAYKIDPTIVDPLAALPKVVPEPTAATEAAEAIAPKHLPNAPLASLALLNLLRGNAYGIVSGQIVANALKSAGKPVTILSPEELVFRSPTDDIPKSGNPNKAQAFRWTKIGENFATQTPLWFYVLAEAQRSVLHDVKADDTGLFLETELLNGSGALTQLGWVGGRIIAEVFYGLLDEDEDSVFNHPAAQGFKSRLAGQGLLCVRNVLDYNPF